MLDGGSTQRSKKGLDKAALAKVGKFGKTIHRRVRAVSAFFSSLLIERLEHDRAGRVRLARPSLSITGCEDEQGLLAC